MTGTLIPGLAGLALWAVFTAWRYWRDSLPLLTLEDRVAVTQYYAEQYLFQPESIAKMSAALDAVKTNSQKATTALAELWDHIRPEFQIELGPEGPAWFHGDIEWLWCGWHGVQARATARNWVAWDRNGHIAGYGPATSFENAAHKAMATLTLTAKWPCDLGSCLNAEMCSWPACHSTEGSRDP